jgi:arylsulfatase A-like enzyme
VPFVARWPDQVPAATTSARPIGLQDIFATVAELIGEPLPAGSAEDSVSFAPSLRDPSNRQRAEGLVHHSQLGAFAIRQGRWKLCLTPGSGGQSAPKPGTDEERGLPPMQLYDLDDDPGETRNLIGEHPDVAKRLQSLLEQYEIAGRTRQP